MCFMQFSHQFQDYWTQRSPDIVLRRLEHTSLNNLAIAQFQNLSDHLVQLVNEISIDVINSFQHHVARVNQDHGISGAPHPSVTEAPLNLVASNDQAHSADAQGPLAIFSNPSVAPPHPSESLTDYFVDIMRTQGNDATWAPPMSDFAGFEHLQLNLDDGNGEHGNHGGAAGDDAAKPPESTFPSEQFASDLSPGDDWDLVSRFK
ncbi:hypothetical protein SLS60_009665 [Paraconiothyrium brasiliense]|uniref:Uncharacterized protein n=1 Tax=Paraconiothyrium brasiliense TaxID=300254 RepID=A0ABR3QUY5_9PLEO